MGNNCEIYAFNNDPRNLQVRVVGSGDVKFGNSADVFAQVYAPQSVFGCGNNAIVRGSVIAREINLGNSPNLYDDQSQQGAGAGAVSIALVE
jgi:hypothetical protein